MASQFALSPTDMHPPPPPPLLRPHQPPQFSSQRPQHKRNKSSSVLKALVSPIGHRRNASEDRLVYGDEESCVEMGKDGKRTVAAAKAAVPRLQRLPSDDVFVGVSDRSDDLQGRGVLSPSGGLMEKKKMMKMKREMKRGENWMLEMGAADGLGGAGGSGIKAGAETGAEAGAGHGKKKSAANLAGLLSKAKSYGNGGGNTDKGFIQVKDKENTTPSPPPQSTSTLRGQEHAHTPIFAQFTGAQLTEMKDSARNANANVNANTGSPTKAPQIGYSKYNINGQPPSNQSSSGDDCIHGTSGETGGRRALQANSGNAGRPSTEVSYAGNKHQYGHVRAGVPARRPLSVASAMSAQQSVKADARNTHSSVESDQSERVSNKGSKEDLDAEAVNAAFEKVLDARNIPENMRQKMRTLNLSIKVDFVRKNSSDMPATPARNKSGFTLQSNSVAALKGKNATINTGRVIFEKASDHNNTGADTSPEKRSRIRSRTFTLGKGESIITKKHKSDRHDTSLGLLRPEGAMSPPTPPPSSPSKSLQFIAGGIGSWSRSMGQPTLPGDFVAYLRKVQKPEVVEVGKVHKLRLLLRNETVSWVNTFIDSGGMAEIVGLIHRILEIEWREEHEDLLLHESLLCLKGLCTTDMAQQKLCEVDSKLFPALLATLFDKEHKGPSEFTTRSIIINLLFAHLSSALGEKDRLESRAQTILSYLRDPQEEESSRPLEFILEMQQPRPYRIWCREISNVTKEVFWIFIHKLNVIPLDRPTRTENDDNIAHKPAPATLKTPQIPGTSVMMETTAPASSEGNSPYTPTHYPPARPPVPAAPYVGGVEWDATNYLAAHLDLLNGLLASLPMGEQRNALRAELRLSGFEKVMGSSLRTCKEKFYGSVHAGLRTWVAAAAADGWSASDVRAGPKEEIVAMAAAATAAAAAAGRKSPVKKKNNNNKAKGGSDGYDDGGSNKVMGVAVQPLKLELDSARGRDGLGLGLDFAVS